MSGTDDPRQDGLSQATHGILGSPAIRRAGLDRQQIATPEDDGGRARTAFQRVDTQPADRRAGRQGRESAIRVPPNAERFERAEGRPAGAHPLFRPVGQAPELQLDRRRTPAGRTIHAEMKRCGLRGGLRPEGGSGSFGQPGQVMQREALCQRGLSPEAEQKNKETAHQRIATRSTGLALPERLFRI
ncbi:protein of unassigned function [Methylobacterium oryzae CBMB20]|uniref:Protein of unassigned function n=1 Tax=Methylobacterium oryzae CBMB20 TaxID=693986 RepID=A0A089NYK5_9HYPH|nr:protein of unassigned function [Methylobacterium oryzae CBMB20]